MSVIHVSTGPAVRLVAVGVIAGAAVLLPAAGAEAHVRVIPESTAAGDFTKLTFRVPNESQKASTIKLSIQLPAKTPLAFVSAQPVPGWKVTVDSAALASPVTVEGTKITKAPSRVTWTAEEGQGTGVGEFQEFALSAGPLPDESQQLSFPATQTYSDGTVVTWNQPQPPGAEEPEFPVPAFDVTAAKAESSAEHNAAAAKAGPSATGGDDAIARTLGGAGLAAGVLGIGIAAWAFTSRRVTDRP